MDDVMFQYLIDNQELWSKQARERDRLHYQATLQKNKDCNWYGNSKEYKRERHRMRFYQNQEANHSDQLNISAS